MKSSRTCFNGDFRGALYQRHVSFFKDLPDYQRFVFTPAYSVTRVVGSRKTVEKLDTGKRAKLDCKGHISSELNLNAICS